MEESISLNQNRCDTSPEFLSAHINSRRILSAEDIPQSLSWRSQKGAAEDLENSHPEKETGFYPSRGPEFLWSVPEPTKSSRKNKIRSSRRRRSITTRELRDSARNFLHSDKAWLTTHSTVEVQSNDVDFQCSNAQTFMNLIKGSTGTGILTLPLAFMNAGLWAGFFGFLLVSLVSIHCMHIMVRSAVLLEKRSCIHIQSYPEVLGQCLTYGPKRLQWMAPAFEMFGHAIIYIMQCSFCCVFIVWMAVNVKNDLPDAHKRPAFKSWENMPLFLGAAVYCFECVCLVIPLRGRMRQDEDMGGWTGLLTLTETVVVAMDTAIGFYGYLKFGEATASAITLNLPQGEWLYHSVTLMFAASVFFSLAIQFYVPVAVLWPAVDSWLTDHWPYGYKKIYAECFTRASLLTLILLFAVLVPHIDLLVELIGSLFGCLVSMIVPAVVEIILMSGKVAELNMWTLLKDFIIIIVGIVGLISGTYSSMLDIVESF